MVSVEDTIDLDFTEDDILSDELFNAQRVEHAETVVSLEPKKLIHGKEQRMRKSRYRHARVRYNSSPASEGDDHSRTAPSQRGDVRLYLLESNFQRREKRLAHARRFGIDPPPQIVDVKEDQVEELYRSMDVHLCSSRHRLHSVYVRGVDGLSTYQIEKMFAEFDPVAVEMIDEVSCNVIWNDRFAVVKMMLEMTKPLKRIRGSRQVEEGEVAESGEEEDGEMREEQGDDVTINMVKGSPDKKNAEANVIEVEVDQVEIPPGKWRVITKHVGHKRLIILRFSLREDIAKGRKGSLGVRRRSTSGSMDPDGYTYKWMNRRNRVRPGLNIFDEKGNELEWDYEHDTRFYEEPEEKGGEEKKEGPLTPVEDEVTIVGVRKRNIKTRGRGAKRFKTVTDLLSDSGSLAADREDLRPLRRITTSTSHGKDVSDGDESDLSDDRDPSPTPQPWDLKNTSVHLRVSDRK